jgi:DNA topoisomerase-1
MNRSMTTKTLPIESLLPEELARLAKLRYVTDEQKGFSRQRNGVGCFFLNERGLRVRKRQLVSRIESLAIPPAWTDVWICRHAEGHLQATGRDDRGRKQYIYHERWREISNVAKFWRMRQGPRLLPALRRGAKRDLGGRGLTRSRVLAGMVALMDLTSIRVGNEEYVRQNDSYGLTTLRNRHVKFAGRKAILRFRAKGGTTREAVVEEPRLVKLLKELKRLPGIHVFQYVDDDGTTHTADATTLNEYLHEKTQAQFTAKDFRTWKASALAAGILYEHRDEEKLAVRKRRVKEAVCAVSDALGNTPTVCKTYYIHTGLLESYLDGQMPQLFGQCRPRRSNSLSGDEQILAHFLRRWPLSRR